MEDIQIIDLYWARSESAITETDKKYGKYCYYIAYNILYSNEDTEECVNDTYMQVWNNIPPSRPFRLSAYIGKITRNLALNRYTYNRTQKRNLNMEIVLEEAKEIVSGSHFDDLQIEEILKKDAINSFVASLSQKTRIIFVRRYWYLSTIKDIANDYGIPENTVKSILSRTRKQFKEYLLKEGINI